MTSPATEMSVSSSTTAERSTGARNASSDGDRRRRSDENIAAEAIGDFFFFFPKFGATQMVILRRELFPQRKGKFLEESVFWVWKRWQTMKMKQFGCEKIESFKEDGNRV